MWGFPCWEDYWLHFPKCASERIQDQNEALCHFQDALAVTGCSSPRSKALPLVLFAGIVLPAQ